MKHLFVIIAALGLSLGAHAQKMPRPTAEEVKAEFETLKTTFDESPDEWIFSKVVDVNGKTAQEIYTAAKSVLASLYTGAKDVVQSDDPEAGVLVGKGFCVSDFRTYSGFVISVYRSWQVVKIECRDSRFKVSVSTSEIQFQAGSKVNKNDFSGSALCKPAIFYPYNTQTDSKMRRALDWDCLKFVYSSGNKTVEAVEKGVLKHFSSASDNW